MNRMIILGMMFSLIACRETRAITSTEVDGVKDKADFSVSDAEADRMMAVIRDRIDKGEDLSPSMTRIIQIVMNKDGPDRGWKGLQVDTARQQKLAARYQTYLKSYKTALDSAGFVAGCDGLLFTSLLVASGLDQNIALAESTEQPGRWYRSADHNCYPSGQSRSSISRDMLLGLSLALWQSRNGQAVDRMLLFHQTNKGILGDAVDAQELAGAATMSPGLLSLLAEMDYRLNGRLSANRGYFPEIGQDVSGFEANLLALRLMLKSVLYGGLLESDFQRIARQVRTQPLNALFLAIHHGHSDGDGNPVADLLLDETYFPAKALPGSAQRCEPYLWQRDQNSADWRPCAGDNQLFPAVDFFWVHALLTQGFRR